MIRRAERLLLDTHVLTWIMLGEHERRLRRLERDLDASGAAGRVHVSAISGWEIGHLVNRGRLQLNEPVWTWFQRAISMPGIRALDVTPDVAVEGALLPGAPPGDPGDRILIATARLRGLTLLTADRGILDYAEAGHVRAVEAA